MLTFVLGEHLAQTEVMAAHSLQVVLLQGPLDNMGRLILTGQLGTTQPQISVKEN